ncbi:basic phospholipase A2 pseudexin A chain-like isoform X2 [Homarus americanus]|uniref:basic phospholipase A2 pseudexin A chain-like isoform X2 n=1 Tax=Homarus americanus TaxID=6706 RepID=UPI001C47A201|nr:basic phospholipase A2 pseudexin A chain-like isoform X2 [Homarus americanus]
MKCLSNLAVFAIFCGSLTPTSLTDQTAVATFLSEENQNNNKHQLTDQNDATTTTTTRRKRSVFHLYSMMTCATTCNPFDYKGYGCYCGFLGSGVVVDGIDKCCKGHDWCYEHARCTGFDHYFTPYKWKCNGGKPYCVTTKGPNGAVNSCGHQLCECDREFVECLKQYPCPKTRAMCMTSPWRNIIHLGKFGRSASIALQTLL